MSEKVDNVALQVIVRKLDAVFLVLAVEDDLAARDVDGLSVDEHTLAIPDVIDDPEKLP